MGKDNTDDIRAALVKKKARPGIPTKDLLSTGSTVLNLACSGRTKGGFPKGKYIWIVGDSESGKTFFSMTCLAEAVKDPEFKGYRFIHDDPEDGASMNKATFFGKEVAARIEPPRGTKEDPVYSETAEDFYESVDDALKDGRPFIYILDSENALTTRSELEDMELVKKFNRGEKGGKDVGSMGTEKAKVHSKHLRVIRNRLRANGSILIIISQTRDLIGALPFQEKTTVSGGRAVKFYADMQVWLSLKGRLTEKLGGEKGKSYQIGSVIQIKVKKNRTSGKHRIIEVPFRDDYGIDDLAGCVDYLVEEKHWEGSEKMVTAPEFDFKGRKEDLIRLIETDDREQELVDLVGQVWASIEAALAPDRKKRYT